MSFSFKWFLNIYVDTGNLISRFLLFFSYFSVIPQRNCISLSYGTIDPRFICELRREKVSFFNNFLFESNRSESISATDAGNEKGNCIDTSSVLIYDLRGCGDFFFFSQVTAEEEALVFAKGTRSQRPSVDVFYRAPWNEIWRGECLFAVFPFVLRSAHKNCEEEAHSPNWNARQFRFRGNRWYLYMPLIRAMFHASAGKISAASFFIETRHPRPHQRKSSVS